MICFRIWASPTCHLGTLTQTLSCHLRTQLDTKLKAYATRGQKGPILV